MEVPSGQRQPGQGSCRLHDHPVLVYRYRRLQLGLRLYGNERGHPRGALFRTGVLVLASAPAAPRPAPGQELATGAGLSRDAVALGLRRGTALAPRQVARADVAIRRAVGPNLADRPREDPPDSRAG